jgi:hypothetical protein
MLPATIFCDESGFTGPDLLQGKDLYFSFASVSLSGEEAAELTARLIKDYHVQGGELKGRLLLKYAKGRRAVAEVFHALDGRYRTALFEKRYALAGKFFEYIFEPVLASHSLIFYALRFHLFIANLLYLHFRQKARYAEEIFEQFQEMMRSFDDSSMSILTSKLYLPEMPPVLDLVSAFTIANYATVREEIETVVGSTGKWTLDLSSTALQSLLGEWAEVYDVLDVTCDESKPLAASKPIHDLMVGNTTKAYSEIFGDRRRITYNLARPIQFAKSHECAGIQLADVVAAATAAVFESPENGDHDSYRDAAFAGMVRSVVVLPVLDEVDLNEPAVARNYLILKDVVRRSVGHNAILPDAAEFALRLTAEMKLPLPNLDEAFTKDDPTSG